MPSVEKNIKTPKACGFRMPAEWEPHERTWMMWPSRREVWADMEETKRNYTSVAHAVREFEPVTMVVRPDDCESARSLLGSDVDILEFQIDDSWARDAGPCFLKNENGERAGASFQFNAWGNKYTPYEGDNNVSSAILDAVGVSEFTSSLIAEGGGVSVDGEGTILTTQSCFPNKNRNPHWSIGQIEAELLEMLGGEKVIWLPGNAEEIETDGHVDGIAVFVSPGTVLIESPGHTDHEWHEINKANIECLQGQTDAKGRPINLVMIPEATEADDAMNSEIFCRSYVNSYITNSAVVMPKYGIKDDDLVKEILQEVLPGRTVLQVAIPSIAIGGGGIHCITQQEPA